MKKTYQKLRACILTRVSTNLQDYNRQISDLTKIVESHGNVVVNVIAEKVSGAEKMKNREGIQDLLKRATNKEFDIIYISEISRLGRSNEVFKLLDQLTDLKVSLHIADLNITTLDENGDTSFQANLLIHIMQLYAQSELKTLKSRIRSGMMNARDNRGVKLGRPKGQEDEEEFLKKYPKVIDGLKKGFSVRECVKLYDVSLGTVAKVRKLILPELKQAS